MGPPPLIDTNILIDFLAGVPAARDEIAAHTDRAISVISRIELLAGVDGEAQEQAEAFLRQFLQIELTPAIAAQAVVVRRNTRLKLPGAILLATAQMERRILITRNTLDFQGSLNVRIPYSL